MKKYIIKFLRLIISILSLSCASKKDVLYLQNIESLSSQTDTIKNTPVIRKNDLLAITVSSVDKISAQPFNLPVVAIGNQQEILGNQQNTKLFSRC